LDLLMFVLARPLPKTGLRLAVMESNCEVFPCTYNPHRDNTSSCEEPEQLDLMTTSRGMSLEFDP